MLTPSVRTEEASALEGVATEILKAAGLGGAVDVYELALWAGCEVRVGRPGMRPCLLGRTVIVADGDPPERQRFATAHELGHLFLREREIPDSEWRVNWLASALLHPRAWFLSTLRTRGWDLDALRVDCRYSSYEAIGRRIVNVRRAVLWVCDRGPNTQTSRRTRSLSLGNALSRSTAPEREAVKLAAETLAPSRVGPVAAWPLPRPERSWLRVVSLADADALVRHTAT
jgi:hypothetical protein